MNRILIAAVVAVALTGLVMVVTGSGDGRSVGKESTAETLVNNPPARIIGGEPVIGGENGPHDGYPWFALGKGCGSSLISPEWLLTAAHCKEKAFERVRIGAVCRGAVDPNYTNCDTFYEMRNSTSQYVHPNYNGNTNQYDMRLVHLKSESTVSPVDIDDGSLSFNYTDGQGDLWTAGFGLISLDPERVRPDYLMQLENKYVPFQRCKKSYKKKNGYVMDGSILCVQNDDNKKSACFGDSGGPLYDAANDKLVGVVSSGPSNCKGKPVRYARIGAGYEWIKETICEESRIKPAFCIDDMPSNTPTKTIAPTAEPSSEPSSGPTTSPTQKPSFLPSISTTPSIVPSNEPTWEPSMSPSFEPSVSPSVKASFQIMLRYTESENAIRWCLVSSILEDGLVGIMAEECDDAQPNQWWEMSNNRQLRNIGDGNLCLTDLGRGGLGMRACSGLKIFIYDSFHESLLSIRNKANIGKWGLKAVSLLVPPSLADSSSRHVGTRTDNGNELQRWQIVHR